MSLQVKAVEKKAGFFEVSVAGRLDTSTYTQLENQLKMLMPSASAIVLEMGLLDYISSMGLRVIFKATKDMKAKNGVFMMSGMQPQIKKVFEIANALEKESVFLSVDEADKYFQAMQEKVKREQGL
ncbi:MAG TPA: STAS domain-containing protein [Elusimicrobiales bacterium]|nr:STAS domain-containing protein [Elusimicrobiales bacterium]